ncbi:MAG: hypothetical protein VX252_16915 [Myxococcota bacterium]|nr:hypothetical protein [Myxococcota bacterium]
MNSMLKTLLVLWAVSVPLPALANDVSTPPAEPARCSPLTCPPSQLAREEPCRYVGNFHKESRQILEEMRAIKMVTLDEWACMARALQALDKEMTVKCKEKQEPLEVIEAWQVERYAPCVESEPKAEILECSLLSGDRSCALFFEEVPVETESKLEEGPVDPGSPGMN